MALTYILVQQLVPETTPGFGFFLLVVGFVFFFFYQSNLVLSTSVEIRRLETS